MKPFEFYFIGTPDGDGMTAGMKILTGDPVEIALTLGSYADGALKKLHEPQTAIIVLNAFKKFLELNPDMGPALMKELMFQDGARIIRTPGIVTPFKN